MRYQVDFEIYGMIYDIGNVVDYVGNSLKAILKDHYDLIAEVNFNGWWFDVIITENKEWLKLKLNGKSLPTLISHLSYHTMDYNDGIPIEIDNQLYLSWCSINETA